MIRPRIIPCLLIKDGALTKTTQFVNHQYIGDPINAVKIFNEKNVDELIILDIDATIKNKSPNLSMIDNFAAECRMPLCYGGGIKTTKQICDIIEMGVEKVSLSSTAINDPEIVKEAVSLIGSQSVVVTIDVKKSYNNYYAYINNGKVNTKCNVIDLVETFQEFGVGEIIINSIDKDGMMEGYDISLIKKIKNIINIPLTVIGGAGALSDIGNLYKSFGLIGASAGSLFIYKGLYKAVLINYPNFDIRNELYKNYYYD